MLIDEISPKHGQNNEKTVSTPGLNKESGLIFLNVVTECDKYLKVQQPMV